MIYIDETAEDFQEMRKVHLKEALTPLQAVANSLVQSCELLPIVSPNLEELLLHTQKLLENVSDE
jgi:hypothetical protein